MEEYHQRSLEEQKESDGFSTFIDHHGLSKALSRANHVSSNESFDPRENSVQGEATLRTNLKKRWDDLIIRSTTFKSSNEATEEWFDRIFELHSEGSRHYHTTIHLWEMFELLDICVGHLQCKDGSTTDSWYIPMAWSVFFHDAVYDPKSSCNEKDSAELFRKFARIDGEIFRKESLCDRVITMILATEKHKALQDKADLEFLWMQQLFLDIDMAVLGKESSAYQKYASLIRSEYHFVSRDIYCSKRATILATFLNGENSNEQKHIYLTDGFRRALELRARENLRDEIDQLRNNIIPGEKL